MKDRAIELAPAHREHHLQSSYDPDNWHAYDTLPSFYLQTSGSNQVQEIFETAFESALDHHIQSHSDQDI